VEHIEAPAPVHATCLDSPGDPSGIASLSVEEPDALMRARPGPWEPWRVTARATQPFLKELVKRKRFPSGWLGNGYLSPVVGEAVCPQEALDPADAARAIYGSPGGSITTIDWLAGALLGAPVERRPLAGPSWLLGLRRARGIAGSSLCHNGWAVIPLGRNAVRCLISASAAQQSQGRAQELRVRGAPG